MDSFELSGTRSLEPSLREKKNSILSREIAERAVVLLKNDGILPLSEGSSIALLGSGAGRTVKGGIGSGDVNNRNNVSIAEGMRLAGLNIVSERWIEDYECRYLNERLEWKKRVHRACETASNPFEAYASTPFSMPEGDRIISGDTAGAEAAVYVISRISGEGKDRRLSEGDYYLSDKELNDLSVLNSLGIPIILLLNTGGQVEITDVLESCKNISAVLNMSQLGQQGGYAVARLLLGRAVPEGKLSSTWARRYADYPGGEDFSYLNGSPERDEYREGIYVGYRYFDSYGVEPLYPFGYGLSYTNFSLEYKDLEVHKGELKANISVRNTGDRYSGREVAQLYLYMPRDSSERELKRLVGFKKSSLLSPHEEESLSLSFSSRDMAVFSEEEQGYIIPKGEYYLGIGTSSKNVIKVLRLLTDEKIRLSDCGKLEFPEQPEFKAPAPTYTEPDVLEELPLIRLYKNDLIYQENKADSSIRVQTDDISERALYEELEATAADKLLPLFYGNPEGNGGNLGASGTRVPGTAGETSGRVSIAGLKPLIMADGPAGIRLQQHYELDEESGHIYEPGLLGSLENGFLSEPVYHEGAVSYYQFATAFPVGTALAQTWDIELMERLGRAVSEEMSEFHISLWLAPGMNIQRNPLCGRNFEYYSEDPLLTGKLAAALTRGVQSLKGCGVTIKHFAANNQEDSRMSVNAVISEKALREIYLRGFEIAVKEGCPAAIMSSYNLINGEHTANSHALCTQIAREEWGFEGIIMSDWSTTEPSDGSIPWRCIAAGNDLIMPGSKKDEEDILRAYHTGELDEEVIRQSAKRILRLIYRLQQ